MKKRRDTFRFAVTVVLIGFLATGCPTDTENGLESPTPPQLQGVVTINFDYPLNVDTIVTAGTINLTAGGSIYFQWQRGVAPYFTNVGNPIVDGNTYTITNDDIDYQIRVIVTRAGTSGQIPSAHVGPVPAPDIQPRLVAEQIAALHAAGSFEDVTITTTIADERIAPQTLAFGGRQVTITLTRGNPGDTLYLAGPGAMFTVGGGVTLVLEDIELRGIVNNTNVMVAVQNGGALVMDTGARIAGNVNTNLNAANQGGGVRVGAGGVFVMEGGEIYGNTSVIDGGGVVNMGDFTMNDGNILDNTAVQSGGGVINMGAFTMENGNIRDNAALMGGGVANNLEFTFIMRDGAIRDNIATGIGGGVANLDTFHMYGGVIDGNISDGPNNFGGGGVLNINYFYMHGGVISGNSTQTGGGGVLNFGTFILHDGEIRDNTGTLIGGGVENMSSGTFHMHDGIISDNITHDQGGGVSNRGVFQMDDGEIFGNESMFGGGVSNFGTFTMDNGAIFDNTTMYGGGVSNLINGVFNMRDGEIRGNTAQEFGGGVLNASGIFRMSGGIIYGTDAPAGGNVAYEVGAALANALVTPGVSPVSQFGPFVNGGFVPNGNLPITDLTIEVAGGYMLRPSLPFTFSDNLEFPAERLMRPGMGTLPELPGESELRRLLERSR